MRCMESPSGEAWTEICSKQRFVWPRLPVETWVTQEIRSWIKQSPLSSDVSSLNHGYGDPDMDKKENNCKGERDTEEEEPSSPTIPATGNGCSIQIGDCKKRTTTRGRIGLLGSRETKRQFRPEKRNCFLILSNEEHDNQEGSAKSSPKVLELNVQVLESDEQNLQDGSFVKFQPGLSFSCNSLKTQMTSEQSKTSIQNKKLSFSI